MNLAFVGPEYVGHRPPIDFANMWESERCMTGTEHSVASFAREMVKRGHQVTLYYHDARTSFDGVTVKPLSTLFDDSPSLDVVCLWAINPDGLRLHEMRHQVARVYYTTGNSFDPYGHNFEDNIDLFLSPSENHKNYMLKWTLTHTNKWQVLPLGCYVDDYDISKSVPGRVIHISSPDRGLHWVLQEWMSIRERVPEAHLKIFYYGLEDYIRNALPADSEQCIGLIEHGYRARYIDRMLKELAGQGVELVGSASRKRMAEELSSAMVLAYPCDTTSYSEGFSVSTLEGCASGALPIIVGCDALGSIYGQAVPCVAPPAKKNLKQWSGLVVRALTEKRFWSEWVMRARSFAHLHDYSVLAERMEGLFNRATEQKHRTPAAASRSKLRLDVVLTPFAMGAAAGVGVDPECYTEVSHGGGSLTGCMHLVHALRRRGDYDVRTYARFTRLTDGFLQLESFNKDEARDVLFTFYDTSPLRDVNNTRLRIASHHTYLPPDLMFPVFSDVNTAPSWHAVEFLQKCFHPRGKWYVLPNGVTELPSVSRRPIDGRVIHHGSPDRGLHVLLNVWPDIRRQVPHATLHVIGDIDGACQSGAPLFDSYARTAAGSRILELRRGRQAAEAAGGVTFLGRVPMNVLAQELSEAACFAYPCAPVVPCETFSISTMECMRHGVPVVLSPADGIGFYFDMAKMVTSPVEEHQDEFAESVVKVLRSKQQQIELSWRGKILADRYTHARMAHVLDQIIRENLPR